MARMLSAQLRIRVATLLLALGALASARMLPRAVERCQAEPKADATVPFLARFEGLKPLVKESPMLGYWTRAEEFDHLRPDPAKRLYLAQFALAPHVIERRTDREWVIFDSDSPDAMPDVATCEGWTLVADLHNGVKLFRTGQE